MSNPNRPEFERQRYWQGQTLRSRDLNDQLAVEDEMRWWHNRALHQAYGVVKGLEVSVPLNNRRCVSPGIAYDCYGRELRLLSPTFVADHEATGKEVWTLLIRYRERSRTCDQLGSPLSQEVEFIWKLSCQVNIRDGVPIKEISASGDETFLPPNSRPLARPLIERGSTVAGKTDWRSWNVILPNEASAHGIEVSIDTSVAGFTNTPCYFAWLHGGLFSRPWPRIASEGGGFSRFPVDPNFSFFVIDRITEVEPARFTFSLRINLWNIFQQEDPLSFARHSLYVCWLGLQTQDTTQDY